MIRIKVLASWNSLQEQITNGFYQLQKANYTLEREQNELIKKVEKIVEFPVKDAEMAAGLLVQLRVNCWLTETDRKIQDKLTNIRDAYRFIGCCSAELNQQEERQLIAELTALTSDNKLLKDYLATTCQLINLIFQVKYGLDPNDNDSDSEPTIEEVD